MKKQEEGMKMMGDLVAMVKRRATTSSYERLNTTSGDPNMKIRVSLLNLNLNLWATSLRDAYVDAMLSIALRLVPFNTPPQPPFF